MRRLGSLFFAACAIVGAAWAQSWSAAYEAGLAAARGGDWAKAREGFKQAAAYRTEDVSGVTLLPGPATERKAWRDGSPYSPNFLAAYCAYRMANETRNQQERTQLLNLAAGEFSALLAKGQISHESAYFLGAIYSQLGDIQKHRELEARLAGLQSPPSWKVDTEVVAPEDLAQINQLAGRETPVKTVTPDVAAGAGVETRPATPPTTPVAVPLAGRVPPILTKYALIIGNSESQIPGEGLPFASDDAQAMRQALVTHGGYAEENVDLVLNATAAQLQASVEALAQRVPQDATVFVFFAGVGANVDGKDFIAGVDTRSLDEIGTMVAKSDLYRPFVAKGARIFAFFEANRPIVNGRFFGMEVPMFGMIAQAQATIPGQQVFSLVRHGKTVGAYVDAMAGVLAEFRSNRIPIQEFGWQVFYRIRRGDTGTAGGSSSQTPTLPVLTNMASDAKF